MVQDLEKYLKIPITSEEVNLMPPLVWAYIGDSVYELYIRNYLVTHTKMKPHKLHIETIKYVKPTSQAEILKNICETLTEEEKDIVRRGRNTENHHLPKSAPNAEYSYPTAFQALIGYLYLTDEQKRLQEILQKIIG